MEEQLNLNQVKESLCQHLKDFHWTSFQLTSLNIDPKEFDKIMDQLSDLNYSIKSLKEKP